MVRAKFSKKNFISGKAKVRYKFFASWRPASFLIKYKKVIKDFSFFFKILRSPIFSTTAIRVLALQILFIRIFYLLKFNLRICKFFVF